MLLAAREQEDPLVREHIDWALAQEPQPGRSTPLPA
jgi:hypothetical protein